MGKARYEKDVVKLSNYIAKNFPLAMEGGKGLSSPAIAIRLLKVLAQSRMAQEDVKAAMYVCVGCGRKLPWSNGAADDHPEHCDQCWALLEGYTSIPGATVNEGIEYQVYCRLVGKDAVSFKRWQKMPVARDIEFQAYVLTHKGTGVPVKSYQQWLEWKGR